MSGVVGPWEVLRRAGERLTDTVARVGSDAFSAHVAAMADSFETGAESTSMTEPARSAATA